MVALDLGPSMASSRHAIDVFDPAVAKRHDQMELRSKMGGQSHHMSGQIRIDPNIQAKVAAKMADAFAKQASKMRAREEERRRRDPTFREDAIDLSTANMRPFDKWTDYCELPRPKDLPFHPVARRLHAGSASTSALCAWPCAYGMPPAHTRIRHAPCAYGMHLGMCHAHSGA